MKEKIKIKISYFLSDILENDAYRFLFIKNNHSNKNGLINKLIPTLVAVRKIRRDKIESVLINEYNNDEAEVMYDTINSIIEIIYFNNEELHKLEEYIWIRPSKNNEALFDEIEYSECKIIELDLSSYIRNLLNEYSMLPQYKREALVFDYELDVFAEACLKQNILCFKNKLTGEKHRVFAFEYCFGYLYDQTNYCIFYDINKKIIKAISLHNVEDIYMIKEKYKPNNILIDKLQEYTDNKEFDKEILMEELI